MTLDSAALGLALRTRNSVRPQATRTPLTLLVFGQSTEQGPVPLTDKVAYPNAFTSTRNPGFAQKRLVAVANRGGWWSKVYDDLWDWGYDADILNAAIGGASLPVHFTGSIQARQSSYPYYKKRTGTNFPDLGDFGDLYAIGSKIFNVTTGRNRQALNDAPFAGVVGTSTLQDFVAFGGTSEATAASAPDVSATNIGDTITDGTIQGVRVNEALLPYDAAFYPGIDSAVNGGLPNRNLSGTLGEQAAGYGWDPLGLIASAARLAAQASPASMKLLYFSQGQTDLGISSAGYQRALQLLANYFLRRGWTVFLGNTIYSPGSAGSTTANYDNQVAGVDAAIAALATYYPGQIYRGANLYSALGTTGPMGGQKCTGSISGSTLTVSAVQASSGTGIAVGQNVWSGQTLVGTISALGTGTGGTGTYTLTGAVTTGSTALVCAGSGLQYDGIHQNGSMVAAGGAAIASSIKAVLPQRVMA